jgi:hypothetical protein
MPWEAENGLLPGRGAPGRRDPGAPPRPGRPPVEPGRGRGPGWACPLPGVGSPVRAAGGSAWPGARGTPGRGPGVRVGSGCGARVSGIGAAVGGGVVSGTTGSTGAAGAAGRAGGGVVTTGSGAGRGGAVVTDSTAGTSAGGAATGFLSGFLAGAGALTSFSRSRRTTGASTVEEAERTNSPMSLNVVRTVLLSTPSSFASS